MVTNLRYLLVLPFQDKLLLLFPDIINMVTRVKRNHIKEYHYLKVHDFSIHDKVTLYEFNVKEDYQNKGQFEHG